MIRKLRVTIVATVEVETDYYPDGSTAKQCAEIDFENDAGMFLSEGEMELVDAEFLPALEAGQGGA